MSSKPAPQKKTPRPYSKWHSLLAYFNSLQQRLSHGSSCTKSASTACFPEQQVATFTKQADAYYLAGQLDYETVPFLWQQSQSALKDRGRTSTLFDLSGVTQTDSSGIAFLIALTRACRQRSQPIRFIHLPHQMSAIIRLAGLEAIMPITA